ncbi:MAG: preprotein translocase subunit SecA, partial [Gammaproteobacteria bacterium]
ALGAYPQREDEKQNWFERAGEKFLRAPFELVDTSRIRLKLMLPAIRREGRRLEGLADSELTDEASRLRYALHREGFEPALVASCFALVREVSSRELGMAHYRTQLLGGLAILHGMVAEMETGEGKTLVATLPACAAALAGIPVHVITVNDYLAERDASWMGPIYKALGITVGTAVADMDQEARRRAYACDITYCTNKQVAFDYLRDRLHLRKYPSDLALKLADAAGGGQFRDRLMLPGLCFGIIDEADSVLVDEAVTPLIISRPGDTRHKQEIYEQALTLAREIEIKRDYRVDFRERRIELTDRGCEALRRSCESLEGLWQNSRYREDLVVQALKADILFKRDQQYLVRDGKVDIVDEFTGRVMADRSWEQGLHQIIEVKEGCEITGEQETLGRISYQRFFRRYLKLGGMTGTASELARELKSVYRLHVFRIRPYRKVKRRELRASLLRTEAEKWQRIVARIRQLHTEGRPVLIGTRSVAASEHLQGLLDEAGIENRVLNARQDADEAEIISAAGHRGQVTVATNMAGRGSDIRLDNDALALGGLHVIASERHESRRIDRQLFGRCGRQGDPGSFEVITSLEDELIVRYGSGFRCTLASLLWPALPWIAKPLAVLLSNSAQQAAEKKNAAARARVLRSEDYLEDVLAFAGNQE